MVFHCSSMSKFDEELSDGDHGPSVESDYANFAEVRVEDPLLMLPRICITLASSTLLIDVPVEGVSDNPNEPPPTHRRQRDSGSLFKYFSSSRNNHNIRPLTPTPAVSEGALLENCHQREPMPHVLEVPLRHGRDCRTPRRVPEVPLRIGSPPRHLRPLRCVPVAGKGQHPWRP